ncbi:MAG: hypothetical protein MJ187_01790 [Alphaproteobacteria bacterium]|nr:hypothetical protein [Alphaproteobacteria bacterium]
MDINKIAKESKYLKHTHATQPNSYEECVNTQLFLIDVYSKKLERLKNEKEKNKETYKNIENVEILLKSCKSSLNYLENLDKNRTDIVKIIREIFRLKQY